MAVDFGSLGSAADSLFGALGSFSSAKGYKQAAAISDQNALIAAQSTAIQQTQATREMYRTLGGQRSDIAASGLRESGSALDIIRDSAQQGALTKQLIGAQGAINVLGYQQEAASYRSMAKSAKKSGIGGLVKGIASAAVGIGMFSDERLKEDVEFQYRRDDGIGIYRFRYKGQPTLFEGVMAQDVLEHMPEAVSVDPTDNTYMVDYAMVGVQPKVVS